MKKTKDSSDIRRKSESWTTLMDNRGLEGRGSHVRDTPTLRLFSQSCGDNSCMVSTCSYCKLRTRDTTQEERELSVASAATPSHCVTYYALRSLASLPQSLTCALSFSVFCIHVYMWNNHCHRVIAQLQSTTTTTIIIIIIIIIMGTAHILRNVLT